MGAERLETASRRRVLVGLAVVAGGALTTETAMAASASGLDQAGEAALRSLYADNPKAKALGDHARAILIFPKITKAGFMVGGQTGDGVLKIKGKPNEYYNSSAASVGLQVGAQTYSYVLFFITQSALDYLESSQGWQIGAGPSVVMLDSGAATSLDTTNLTQDVYAMAFGQSGLMGGLTVDGSKITRIHPGA